MRRVLFRLLLDLLRMLLFRLSPLLRSATLSFCLLRLDLRIFSLVLRILGSFPRFLPFLIQLGLVLSSHTYHAGFFRRLNGAARRSLHRFIAVMRVEIVFRLLQQLLSSL